MNSFKSILIGLIFMSALIMAGCNKEFTSRDTSGLQPPVDVPPPFDSTMVMFDPADALDDWEISGGQPRNVESVDKKEGTGWIKSSIVNGGDYIHFIKHRPAALDPNLTVDRGQFVFWLYVSDVALLKTNDGQIEVTSSGQSDQKEYSWNFETIAPNLHNGWNEVALDFSSAQSSSDGGPDIHAFNFFRIYFWSSSNNHPELFVGLDALRFRVKPGPAPLKVSFDPADALDDWEISGDKPRNIEALNKKEGVGWLKADMPNGTDYIHLIKRRPAPIDPAITFAKGQFVFWFYVSNVANLKADGQIELTSSGQSDQNEYSWNLAPIIPTLHDGWNELKLDFQTAVSGNDGGPNIAAFNFFRIYFWTITGAHDDMVVGVDDLHFEDGAVPIIPQPPTVEITKMFDKADALTDWDIAGGQAKTLEATGQQEGDGWIKSAIVNGQDYIHFIKHRPLKVDPELTEANGQFTFWFYVADVASLKLDGQIELTSSNQSDQNEYAWDLAPIIPTLQNGWNELKLNFSDAVKSADGGPDIHGFNFFRIFFWTTTATHADVAVGLDGLRFQLKPTGPVTNPVSLSFNNADALDNWEISGDRGKVIETVDIKEGTGSIKADFMNGVDYLHMIYRRPTVLDAAAQGITEANGQLKFWWYIPDVSAIKMDGQIELTSSGQSDTDEYSWNLDAILPSLQNGWNEVKLDFTANNGRSGNPDFSRFNFFRVYFWARDGAVHPDWQISVDDFRVQTK